ncbi:MAG: TIGR00266 family protein [Acidimicrobiia bacterium]
MDVEIRHSPSFAVARATLAGGESVRAEAGAMLATSAGVTLEGKAEGGVMKSLGRMAGGGESFFINTVTAPPQGGWVDFAPDLPGDLVATKVDPSRGLVIQAGSWLCSEAGVQLDSAWGGIKIAAGGEGFIVLRATGDGQVVLSCYGALDAITLGPGEQIVVDSGHMVAYEDTLTVETRMVTRSSGGIKGFLKSAVQTAKTGEGMVLDFTGPGQVLMQSRNPRGLIEWLTGALPFSRQ